jgi:hypothetical protein
MSIVELLLCSLAFQRIYCSCTVARFRITVNNAIQMALCRAFACSAGGSGFDSLRWLARSSVVVEVLRKRKGGGQFCCASSELSGFLYLAVVFGTEISKQG